MTCTDTKDTGHECSQESGHPPFAGAMAGMMEGCGCGSGMAKMMALCTGADAAGQAPKEDTTETQSDESQGAEQGGGNG